MIESTTPLLRREDESEFQYHKRLVNGKLSDKTLSDYDYTELAKYVYGKDYSADVARRMMYGSQKTIELLDKCQVDKIDDAGILKELNNKIIELQKEKQKYQDYRTAFNKVARAQARGEELEEIISHAITHGNIRSLDFSKESSFDGIRSDNDLLVSLNDIHYGSTIKNAWRHYDSDVCAQMFEEYLNKIVEIQKTHDSENCIVVSAGDIISGNIHYSIAVSNQENIVEQIIGASELIAQFLSELSKYFNTVTFVSVAGNHSRLNPNKDNELVGERLDNLTDWYLKARLQNFDNIIIRGVDAKLDDTVSVVYIRGKLYAICHGDFDVSDSKIQSLATLVRAAMRDEPYAIFCGHKHHNALDDIQGMKVIMAGSFLGVDDYCVQKRIYGKPEQLVCVCDTDGVVCYYNVSLDK